MATDQHELPGIQAHAARTFEALLGAPAEFRPVEHAKPAKPRRSGASDLGTWWRGRDLSPPGYEGLDKRPASAASGAFVTSVGIRGPDNAGRSVGSRRVRRRW